MPLTFSHPAIVLPLARFCAPRISLPALIIGSLCPDFAYYLHCFELATYCHGAAGSMIVCLPVGLVFLALYYWLFPCFLKLLPSDHGDFLSVAPPCFDPRFLAISTAALFIGIASHNSWDSCTHASGFTVQRVDWLRASLHAKLPVFKLLQHASSVFGLLAIVLFYRRRFCAWRKVRVPVLCAERKGGGFLFLTLLIASSGALILHREQLTDPFSFHQFLIFSFQI